MSMKRLLPILALGMIGGELTTRKQRITAQNVSGEIPSAPVPKGLKKFVIGGKVIYALNEKNAKRKAQK